MQGDFLSVKTNIFNLWRTEKCDRKMCLKGWREVTGLLREMYASFSISRHNFQYNIWVTWILTFKLLRWCLHYRVLQISAFLTSLQMEFVSLSFFNSLLQCIKIIFYTWILFFIAEVMSNKSLRTEWTCRPSSVPIGQKSCLREWSYSLSEAWSQCAAKFEHEVGLSFSDLLQKQHTSPIYCIPYSL